MARRPRILPALLLGLSSACGDPATPPAPPVPTTLELTPESLNLDALAATARFAATVFDQHGQEMTGVPASWRSTSPAVATVDQSGLVTAAGNGSAYVTATAGDAKDSARVVVRQRPASLWIRPGHPQRMEALADTVPLTAEVLDPNGRAIAGAPVTWSAGDTTVATVSQWGLVTAVANGYTTVKATSGSLVDFVEVRVRQVPAVVRMSPADDTLRFESLGDTVRLSAEVLDANGHAVEGVQVAWSTSDLHVATIDRDGLVTARGNGTAAISATTHTVTASTLAVVDQVPVILELSSTGDLLAVGDSVRMTARAFDAGGSPILDAGFTWTSSDIGVATVNAEGWVHAVGEGMAEITVTLKGLSASATVVTASPDEIALLAFFRSTGGPAWTENAGWATDAPLAEWHGVEVDGAARVVSLMLPENDLAGRLPPEIGMLTELRELRLEENLLDGKLPPEIGKLRNLEWLGLARNNLSGPVPPEMGAMERLEVLDLAHNRLTGPIPSELAELPNLWFLGLFFNELSGSIPPEIGDFRSLRVLDLCYNRLTGSIPPEIGRLKELETLSLCGNDQNLGTRNRLTGGIPPEIGSLTNLRRLDLGANRLTGPIPPEIGGLGRLETLRLYSNLLTRIPPEVGRLENLKSLFLYGNRLTGSIPRELGDLAALDSLLLGPGWSSGENTLTGSIPPELGNLTWLRKLDLGHNDLTGKIPSELGKLTRLVFLQLDYNRLSGRIPAELGKLTRLEWLVACANRLSGPIPSELGELRALERLYLCQNRLEGPLPKDIGDLGRLVHMYLGANRLSGEFPESMLSLKRLTELFWRRNNGLCAPKTEEFEDWLRGIPKSSEIFCEAEAMIGGRADPDPADPGICSLTVVRAASASGRGSGNFGAGAVNPAGPRRERAGVGTTREALPGTRDVPCKRVG
ncbi:MAG: Ig-like domain-containing protein [Gemmatimonadota bacterium]|nr:Ig-like domain-containing protein [Gemmatimonadota bacterium]MDE2871533.1 Ig-like domain-containing protein [Gemmatimonadota bacterium]